MELQDFVNSVMAEGVTADQVTAIAQKLVDATTKAAYTSIDTAIETTTGQKRPATMKTHEFVAGIAKSYADYDKEKAAFQQKIQDLSAKTPDVENIKKEYEAKIAGYESSAKAAKVARQLERAALGLTIAEAYKDTFADILEVKIAKILPNVVEKDGDFVLADANGVLKLDNKGRPISAKSQILSELSAFTAQATTSTQGPPRANGSGKNYTSMTTAEKAQFAKDNGINPLTAEGQKALNKLISSENGK